MTSESSRLKTQSTVADNSVLSEVTLSSKVTKRKRGDCMADFATPTSNISAFCRAVISNVLPRGLLGSGFGGEHNRSLLMHNVDMFIKQRCYESLSLHRLSQGFSVTCISWLRLPGEKLGDHISKSDLAKRTEIFLELIYYIFDSFLIPLVRSNFYVTGSNSDSYRLFYFRHDIWKSLTDPILTNLRISNFEEIPKQESQILLDSAQNPNYLGHSQIRLLPKKRGARPIINLARKLPKAGPNSDLDRSINAKMAPVFNVVTFESKKSNKFLGSTLRHVGDMYPRLKRYKNRLSKSTMAKAPLYFVKVDVQSAFDTIPQDEVLGLVRALIADEEYRITKHVHVRPPEDHGRSHSLGPTTTTIAPRFPTKYDWLANGANGISSRPPTALAAADHRARNTVHIPTSQSKRWSRTKLLSLLSSHVKMNVVKIGKRFFRQRVGIPQGSVLSSILCNLFYADFERVRLGFLEEVEGEGGVESLLLRQTDDFLLITPHREHAVQFLETMLDPQKTASHGITINPSKSLVNFEIRVNNIPIPRYSEHHTSQTTSHSPTGQTPIVKGHHFPYIGTTIHTTTLSISRPLHLRKDTQLSNSLTIEYSRNPGATFHKKTMRAVRVQFEPMVLDTALNGRVGVIRNVYGKFVEVGGKMVCYLRGLRNNQGRRGGWKEDVEKMVINAMRDAVSFAFGMKEGMRRDAASVSISPHLPAQPPSTTKTKGRKKTQAKNLQSFTNTLSETQFQFLAYTAFQRVFARKQSLYRGVMGWLDRELTSLKTVSKTRDVDKRKGDGKREGIWISEKEEMRVGRVMRGVEVVLDSKREGGWVL